MKHIPFLDFFTVYCVKHVLWLPYRCQRGMRIHTGMFIETMPVMWQVMWQVFVTMFTKLTLIHRRVVYLHEI